jgi:hypothetical protein
MTVAALRDGNFELVEAMTGCRGLLADDLQRRLESTGLRIGASADLHGLWMLDLTTPDRLFEANTIVKVDTDSIDRFLWLSMRFVGAPSRTVDGWLTDVGDDRPHGLSEFSRYPVSAYVDFT